MASVLEWHYSVVYTNFFPRESIVLHRPYQQGIKPAEPLGEAQPGENGPTVSNTFVLPVLLLIVAVFTLYFLFLGNYPFLDVDEPVYGQVAREMVRGGNWLTPHLAGQLWFDKPPLFYWLSSLSVALLGANELACRLPSALAALGLVALVYHLAAHDFGRKTAQYCALVMATCFQQIMLARAAVTDMTFVFCLTLALYLYRRWLDASPAIRWRWSCSCGLATGLAMLTKGPVAPLLLSAAFVIHLVWIRQTARLRTPDSLLAVISALLVGLPWYLTMYYLHGQAFVQGFLVANNLTRFLKAEHAHQTGQWYSVFFNLPVLLGCFFPWSVFLPQAMLNFWRRQSKEPRPDLAGEKLHFVWFVLVFVFFSISKTQLITYIFPVFPCAAIFAGHLLARARTDSRLQPGILRALAADIALAIVFAAGLVLTAAKTAPQLRNTAILAGAILVATSLIAFETHRRAARRTSPLNRGAFTTAWPWSAGMVCFAAWTMVAFIPGFSQYESTRALVRQLPDEPLAVGSYGIKLPSLGYYLAEVGLPRYIGPVRGPAAERALQGSQPVLIICRRAGERRLAALGAQVGAHWGKFSVMGNPSGVALIEGKIRNE